jgi:hypothetical protein
MYPQNYREEKEKKMILIGFREFSFILAQLSCLTLSLFLESSSFAHILCPLIIPDPTP